MYYTHQIELQSCITRQIDGITGMYYYHQMKLQACNTPINGIIDMYYHPPDGITGMYCNAKDGITGMFYHPNMEK